MCGLVALIALDGAPVDQTVVRRMTQTIVHRGPDDEGFFFDRAIGLGFRRLSILDLSPAGHQPMSTADGRFTIVFNGEIYNYMELRAELMALGHTFRSSGDTEVLLRAYVQWGEKCLARLNGMWAFLIYDRASGRLFGSRDRFGIKPLYYARTANHWILASEIKAIRAADLCEEKPNWPLIAEFLVEHRVDECDETFFDGIQALPPAHAFTLERSGELRRWQYWSAGEVSGGAPSDPAGEFAELFEDSVRLHLRSDVPLGIHLSGGLDSTSILCALARQRERSGASGDLMAFCFTSPEFDESSYIRETLDQTGARLVTLEWTPRQLWDRLGELLRFHDEPVFSMTPVVSYELMRLTRSAGIKVILNGQGADETLAGYRSYFRDYWHTLISRGAISTAWREIGDYVAGHGGARFSLFVRLLRHSAQTAAARVPAYRWLARRVGNGASPRNDWYSAEFTDLVRIQEQPYGGLRAMLVDSVYRTPLPRILRAEDRNSMAHSIEARVPFLDVRLVELALRLPAEWQMRGRWNKYVLREAMRGRIPEHVRTRVDKMGFPTPLRKWLSDALFEPAMDLLSSRQARERGFYDVAAVRADLERHRRGEINADISLFYVLQFELWMSEVFGRDRGAELHRSPASGPSRLRPALAS